MNGLVELLTRLRNVFRWRQEEAEMEEEIRFHLEMATAGKEGEGMSNDAARRGAALAFGGRARVREEVRDARGLPRLEDLWRDAHFAFRSLARTPVFTVVAVVTLSLGIGGNAAVFSVVDAVLLRPMSYPDSDRIVRLFEYGSDGGGRGTISAPNFQDWIERTEVFESAALYDEYRPTLTIAGEPVQIGAASVGASYFDVLGVSPEAGRLFLPEDDVPGSNRVVLAWGLWQEAFGGDPGVIGQSIRLGATPHTVVGIAPRDMEDPMLSGESFDRPRLWRSTPEYFVTSSRSGRSFTAIARLAEGVTVEQAEAELSAVHADLVLEYPDDNANRVATLMRLQDAVVGEVRTDLLMLFAAIGLVLLIACANLANLLLFRSSRRRREIGMRAALGASRRRLVQLLVIEAMVLSILGAIVGLAISALFRRGLTLFGDLNIPRLEMVGTDLRVAAFTLVLALVAALLFGIIPAMGSTARATNEVRGEDRATTASREQKSLRGVLVAAQVGVAVVVVTSGFLLARSLIRLQAVDSGMRTERLITMNIDPPADPYFPPDDSLGARARLFYGELTTRLLSIPGVEAAGLTDILPLSGSFNRGPYLVGGEPAPELGDEPEAELRAIDPGFFRVLGIALVEGESPERAVGPSDIWVNRELADRHWPEGGAVGRTLAMRGEEHRIAGVVGTVTQFSLADVPQPTIYMPHQVAPDWMRDDQILIVRTTGDESEMLPAIRQAVREMEPRMPISSVRSMDSVLGETLVQPRFRTLLFSTFALLALLLAAVGVFAMIANGVAGRRREMAIRLALGSEVSQVIGAVVGEGLLVVAAGIVTGLVGAVLAARLLEGLLFGIAPLDTVTFLSVPALLLAVAAFAAWLPAWRAVRIPLAEVMRGG